MDEFTSRMIEAHRFIARGCRGMRMLPRRNERLSSASCSSSSSTINSLTNPYYAATTSNKSSPISWLALLLLLFLKAERVEGSSPFYGDLGSATDDTLLLPSTSSRMGRARVVVDDIEDDFLWDLIEQNSKRQNPLSQARNSQTEVRRTSVGSTADLQLAWSEPPSSGEHYPGDWFAKQHSTTTKGHQKPSPYSLKSGVEDKNAKRSNMEERFTSTGTTIVGVSGPDYCILAADSRATAGTMVADKACFKLHPLASNCAAAGAGTSADLDHITRACCYTARLMQQSTEHGNGARLVVVPDDDERADDSDADDASSFPIVVSSSNTPPISVSQLCRYMLNRLYQQGGECGANLIVGGVYDGKSVLRAIHPHGSMDVVSYTALGSGGLAAMGVLESSYRGNIGSRGSQSMTIDEAVELAVEAVKAGIVHDMGSGSQVDVCVIGPDGVAKYTRRILSEESLCSLPQNQLEDTPTKPKEGGPVVVEAHGVNGFGNLPCAIVARRTLQMSREQQERSEQKRWNDALGI